MNIIKKTILTLSLIAPLSVYAKPSYIPADLEKFNKTGECINCDLSEVRLDSHDGAKLAGALLVRADLSLYGYNHFYVSDFNHAQLMYADMRYVKASGSNFSSADLTGASLNNGNFSSCNFENANLSGADLRGADFARAKITKGQLAQAASANCAILPDGTKNPGPC